MSDNPMVVVQLMDTGNLVVWDRSTNKENVMWQSFDHPGNTLLPGMKFGKDLATGRERVITPWKSADDPSPGPYLHWPETSGYPKIFVRQGSVLRWRYGPWNGLKFQGDTYAREKKDNNVQIEDLDELPLFSLNKLVKATYNFDVNKKIGEGGFGPVYKVDEQQAAPLPFLNGKPYPAKLQHRNLVKLGNEMMLIYEYMANKSLDTILFDETRSLLLDWPRRLNIIHGIALGILYLHQDSRLQIIHRVCLV
ncbi:putative protein kinase RLK-Pelle-DLSV family [Helianthus anomalus]